VYFDLLTTLPFALLWIGSITFLRLRKRQTVTHLALFTIFYLYLYKVLDYTLLQYQSLLLLRYVRPNLILRGDAAEESINLIPLITLTPQAVGTSLLNVLLLIPFGFGLPFVTPLHMKQTVSLGALFSIVIELLQLITGLIGGMTFRVADVNDVLFNTLGVAIGYVLFLGFGRTFRRIARNWDVPANPLLRHIAERPQLDNQPR
jgi:glycopeptide antibiotics resistance protein